MSPNIKIEEKQLLSGKFKNPATRPGFLVLARLAIGRFRHLSVAFILTQVKFTSGSPKGTWTAPSQVQTLTESFLSAGACGIAVAQGTHAGVVSGEFGGNEITAIALPTTSGSGIPAIGDWVSCEISEASAGLRSPHGDCVSEPERS